MNDSQCRIYLLRHGATLSNLENPPRLQGQGVDLSLSELGMQQSVAAASLLAPLPIAAVYASPLARSRQTAEQIAQPHDVAPCIVSGLIEADVGRWEGKNWREIAEQDPEAHRLYKADAAVHGYPEGENLAQIRRRVAEALEAIAGRHAGQQVVVVGHGMANRAFLAPLFGTPLAWAPRLPQDNCGVNVLIHRQGEWKAITLNATLHLQPVG